MTKGERVRQKHQGITVGKYDQGGLVPPHAVVPTSEVKTGPPDQEGPVPSIIR